MCKLGYKTQPSVELLCPSQTGVKLAPTTGYDGALIVKWALIDQKIDQIDQIDPIDPIDQNMSVRHSNAE